MSIHAPCNVFLAEFTLVELKTGPMAAVHMQHGIGVKMEVRYSIRYEGGRSIRPVCRLCQDGVRSDTGYLSRSEQPCAAGIQVGKGTGHAHSGVSRWSSNKASCP